MAAPWRLAKIAPPKQTSRDDRGSLLRGRRHQIVFHNFYALHCRDKSEHQEGNANPFFRGQAVEEGRTPDGGPVKMAEATFLSIAQCAFLFSLVANVHDPTRFFDLRRRFKSILVKTVPLGLFRVSCGVQTLQQDRLLKVGTQFFPAKPRCEAMWLAIAPVVLLFWLQGSKRPHGAVRKEVLSSSLPWKRFPFITTLFGRQHGRTPNCVELHEFAVGTGGRSHGKHPRGPNRPCGRAPISSSEMSKLHRMRR